MDYILEISRIIDGAVKGDTAKVLAYLEQLNRKLREAGDNTSADRLVKTAYQTKTSEIKTATIGTTPRLPVDSESRLALADEERISQGQVVVILEPPIQQRVDEFIRYVKAADQLLASNVGISPSMLIYGPPGVGKTELAHYVSAELQLPLITARSDSLISSFLGSTAKNLRTLFEHVRSRPCILFLDELDSVAKLRDDHHELGELKRVVVSLLQNIDALNDETVLIAATNHQHLLDPAIWRRFTYKLEMGKPNIGAREKLFQLFLGDYTSPEIGIKDFALAAEDVTGSDIKQICQNAIRAAVLENDSMVQAIEVFREIIRHRLDNLEDFTNTTASNLHKDRDLNPKVFTLNRLALLFGSSEATISRRLKKEGTPNGKRNKTPNKSSRASTTRY